ncbi:hypothetical protein E3O55_02855 [Cryobacterium sp. MDB1-18-2]|uniref:hypothetical protein n=1 Tax=unclassified Cryobacterium TaxID=2649013 RepID=UPI00106AFF5A|nr:MULTISPECIES: hypothetical protein [unclassified Cryobacterium]TFC34167.1 hypothetical protein E3O55_02855 [Cryobacterium sp. MDB1-18-2]TFC46444.1 hypothetical protein E3O50_01020 [Cryobacterium sp. MDB1-18-1]
MNDAEAFRAPRALWLALVAVALGIAWFLCGGANPASATDLLPDAPPATDAAAPGLLNASVPELVASVPAFAVSVVADAPGVDTATIDAASADVPEAVGTAMTPILAAVAAEVPDVSIPDLSIPDVAGSPVTVPVAVPTIALAVSDLSTLATRTVITSVVPAGTVFVAPSAHPFPPSVRGTAGTPDAVASLTLLDAAASATGAPLGTPGHPVNLPQPTPDAAAPGGGSSASLLATCGSTRAASVAALRLTFEDDALPSFLSIDPASSPA